jgi:hypothetical protein
MTLAQLCTAKYIALATFSVEKIHFQNSFLFESQLLSGMIFILLFIHDIHIPFFIDAQIIHAT